jgi:hypothetical protein
MGQEKTIREGDLAELIGMALHLQESRSAAQDHQLSEDEVLQIGEHIGIPAPVMGDALRAYCDLRRDVFRSALGSYVRDELLRRLHDGHLRDLYADCLRGRSRIAKREARVRQSRRELGFFELLNPFSLSPARSAFEQEKDSLRNEQRRLEHLERRLHERIEELLDQVAPLSVILRAERIEQILEGFGALRYSAVGERLGEALAHLKAMRKSVTDAFGVVPRRAELVRMVLDALPELYPDVPGAEDAELAL